EAGRAEGVSVAVVACVPDQIDERDPAARDAFEAERYVALRLRRTVVHGDEAPSAGFPARRDELPVRRVALPRLPGFQEVPPSLVDLGALEDREQPFVESPDARHDRF